MSTIELQTLTGLEIDSRSTRVIRGKIAKWLSARLALYRHLSGDRPAPFVVALLPRSHGDPCRGNFWRLPPIRSFLRWIFRADETTVGHVKRG
ncbi:hypothetical protein [Mesorhizobium sp.]|uniref:hypothetical protein n=1 Tax=Mesorhizobium sp. TaxID=1871066 RepID=UPI000FE79967|nr:hypothetical protein [Mesorhizobium sp.]RWC27049.1 MAG: hypothetical protein EOS27_23120 [Mesorhizobium sp.]TIX22372.1 MAG: hypothetical protein E5V35_26075 [Mesorhizobium sp.]